MGRGKGEVGRGSLVALCRCPALLQSSAVPAWVERQGRAYGCDKPALW